MTPTLRLARAIDAPRIAELYAPYVTEHTTSFELVPTDAAEIATRIEKTLQRWPEPPRALAGLLAAGMLKALT